MSSVLWQGVLVAVAGHPAASIDDGFYRISRDETAPVVVTQDQREVRLGERAQLDIRDARLVSRDNWNQRFGLRIEVPYDESLDKSPWYVLVIGGKAFFQAGARSSPEDNSSLDFDIHTNEDAQAVARYLSVTPRLRRHPGHQLAVRFVPKKAAYAPGEDVSATLEMKNVGSTPVTFVQGGRYRGGRDNQYSFMATYHGRQVEDIGSGSSLGAIAFNRELQPGEEFQAEISLSKWFRFDEKGTYEVVGLYYLELVDPSLNRRQTVWEDYASAKFTVKIEEEQE